MRNLHFSSRITIIGLLVIFIPFYSYAKSLDNYVVGKGGKFQCFPPEDKTACYDSPFILAGPISSPAQAIVNVYTECTDMRKDPEIKEKYAIIAQYMAHGPLGMAAAQVFALSEGIEDFFKCIVKGAFVETSEKNEEEKQMWRNRVDMIFEGKNIGEFAYHNLYKWRALDLKAVYEAAMQFRERLEAQRDTYRAAYRAAEEFFFGPIRKAENLITDVQDNIRECEFESAENNLKEAAFLVGIYCRGSGADYRIKEKDLRCYMEKNVEIIAMQQKRASLGEYGSHYNEAKRMENELIMGRSTILENLGNFEKIDMLQKRVETEKQKFARYKAQAILANNIAETAFKENDLVKACNAVLAFQSTSQKSSKEGLNCEEKVAPEMDRVAAKTADLYTRKIIEVEDSLKQAESAIRDCKLDFASTQIRTARDRIPKLVAPSNNCLPGQKAAELTEICNGMEQRFNAALKSCEEEIVAKFAGIWSFGRIVDDEKKLFLCRLNLTKERASNGYVIRSCHRNESFWAPQGDTAIIFKNNNGEITSTLTRKNDKFWQGPYHPPRDMPVKPDEKIRPHYIER